MARCKCVVWKEATFSDYKTVAEGLCAKYSAMLGVALNLDREVWMYPMSHEQATEAAASATTNYGLEIQVDWDSFEHSANPLKTWPYMRNENYLYKSILRAVRELVEQNPDGAERIASLDAIRLVHLNEGLPDIERVSVVDNVATFTSSYCCYWHAIDSGDVREGLVCSLGIWSGLRDSLYKAAGVASADLGGIPLITDMESFDFEGDEPAKSRRKAKAMIYAGSWRGQRSWGKVADIGGWCSYPSDEEYQRAFGSGGIVIHNIPYTPPVADENGWVGYSRVYFTEYDITNHMFHIYDCFEREWSQTNASYEVASLMRQVMSLFRLGSFTEMSEKQHKEKIELLRMAATGYKVEAGDFGWLQQLLSYPCFYPKDNHDRRATAIQMERVNSSDYRSKIPEDTLSIEARRIQALGRDPSAPEVCIGSFLMDKVSFRGMKQERLIMVTDRATYSVVPRFKGSAFKKRTHRISHAYYGSVAAGKAEWHTMGTPPMPKAPHMVTATASAVRSAGEAVGGAGGAVAGAVRDAVGLGSGDAPELDNTGPFTGPACALKYVSTRLAADEKPPKKWKLPEIPDLKGKFLAALRSIIDTLKSMSLPSIPKPSMPKFKVPSLLDMLRKLKPPMPSMPSMSSTDAGAGVSASEAAAETNAGDASQYSCATGVSSAAQDSIPAISQGLNDKDLPEIEIDWPDLNPIHMLEKIADKIEACAEFVMELPSKLGIIGVLHAFAKAAGKATGLSAISLPKPDFSAKRAVELIQGALEGVAGVGEDVLSMLAKMGEEAAHWGMMAIKAPFVGVGWLLRKIISVFQSIELPHFDVKSHLPGVSLPKLPSVKMPAMHMPGFVGKIGAWAKGPVRPEHVEYVLLPRLPKGCPSGASLYACLEIGWVIAGAAGAYQQSSVSSPYEVGSIPITTSVSSKFYNGALRGVAREGTVSKPSGEGNPLSTDEAIHLEGPNSVTAAYAAKAEHARAQLAAQKALEPAAPADDGAGASS